jgi:hypothetical protein
MSEDLHRGRWSIFAIRTPDEIPSDEEDRRLIYRTLGVFDNLAMFVRHRVVLENGSWMCGTIRCAICGQLQTSSEPNTWPIRGKPPGLNYGHCSRMPRRIVLRCLAVKRPASRSLDNIPRAPSLKRELAAHHYETRERQVIVEKKDKIKAAIRHSPGADSLLAAWRC